MRLAHVGLGSGVGLPGFDRNTAHFRPGPRPILLDQKCQTTYATTDPAESL